MVVMMQVVVSLRHNAVNIVFPFKETKISPGFVLIGALFTRFGRQWFLSERQDDTDYLFRIIRD